MRPTAVVVIGVVLIVLGVSVGWFIFPKFLRSEIIKAKQLKKGTENRKMWTEFPISVNFKIYLFNVTNVDDVQKGGKPHVQEVGPFFYDEWKSKVNLVDNPEEDTITYNMVNTFIFNKKMSEPWTGDEIVFVPHILILTFVTLTAQTKPAALTMINKAIPQIFGDPKTVFMKVTAKELLFEGVLLNCTKSKEFAVNAVCDQIRGNPKGLKIVDENYFKFSLFGTKNGTADENKITVKRGMKNVLEVGNVVAYNGKSEMDIWSGSTCNQIIGSDTTIFPPYLEEKDFWNFGAEICRSLKTVYVGKKDYRGINGNYYIADLGDMSTDEDLKCFCPTNNTCLKKGTYDVTKCTGAPLILTLPHCYECHPDYVNSVVGLNPSKEQHGIYSTFEPITGTPLEGRRRLQFNMFLEKNKKIAIMKDLSEEPILIPIMWVDEGLDLNDTFVSTLKNKLYRPMKGVHIGRYVLILAGVALIFLAIIMYFSKSKINSDNSNAEDNRTTITQVSPIY